MAAPKCYRCGGPTESRDNIQGWGFLGGSIQKVTETTSTTSICIRATRVRHRDDGPWPSVTDDLMPLCKTCWGDVMTFLGVGKRPENRMPTPTRYSGTAGSKVDATYHDGTGGEE